jgi:hypothetical protein
MAVVCASLSILAAAGTIYFYGLILGPSGTTLDAVCGLLMLWSFYTNYRFIEKIGKSIEHNDASHIHK